MPARLSEICSAIPGSRFIGELDPSIETVTVDSRQAQAGGLFVAVRGFKSDGNRYVPAAMDQGAAAVASSDSSALSLAVEGGRGALLVPDDRTAAALAADLVYGRPSRSLKLIGITGTNGKTTTATLCAQILGSAGIPTATLGTLGLSVNGVTREGDRTTPEAPELQSTFRQLILEGVRAAAMEVSSHALSLRRTLGCAFDVAVFTNLTQDHLDYHPTMEDYFQAKRLLFTEYPDRSDKAFTAVINGDDPYGQRLARDSRGRVITFGLSRSVDLYAIEPKVSPASVSFIACFEKKQFPVLAPIGAHFNVYNTLAAVGTGLALGLEPDAIAEGLKSASGVAGRFESVDCGQPYTVIVDYAHSPDGLSNVLQAARACAKRNLLVVFGCGGDRDASKRPKMGRIAAAMADRAIITADNSRSEDPESIFQQILAGVPHEDASRCVIVGDRRAAIGKALSEAGSGDVVVVAGKGHETYQIFKDRTIHFDDREVIRELLCSS